MQLQRRLRTAFTKPFKRKKFEFQKKSKKIFEKLLTPPPAYVMLTALGGNMKKLETKEELLTYIATCYMYAGDKVMRVNADSNPYKDFDGAIQGTFKKFARVSAKQAGAERVGQPLSTIMSDGHIEVKDAIIQNAEDWIVINPNGEAYIIKDEKFRKRYETSVGADGKHAPIADPQDFLLVPEDIEFMVHWGENGAPIPFTLKAGGYLNVTDLENLGKKPISEIDIYGVQKEEFEQTYAPCSREGVFEDKKLRELFNQADRGEKQ